MDKGYDSEKLHSFIREEIKANSVIPVKKRKRTRIIGEYRQQLHKNFDKNVYNRRSIVETVFSVIKRKFGEIVKARKFYNQLKEIKVKMIVYNTNKNIVNSVWLKLRISTKPNNTNNNSESDNGSSSGINESSKNNSTPGFGLLGSLTCLYGGWRLRKK